MGRLNIVAVGQMWMSPPADNSPDNQEYVIRRIFLQELVLHSSFSGVFRPILLHHIHDHCAFFLPLNHAIKFVNFSLTSATATTCSQISVEKLTHVRSHDNEPPFSGLTLWILLQLPATTNDSSVTPGLGMTDPSVFTNRSAFSNI